MFERWIVGERVLVHRLQRQQPLREDAGVGQHVCTIGCRCFMVFFA